MIPPRWAHVPGETAAPDHALLGDLHGPGAVQNGYRLIEAGFFWEAHEVLEAAWMRLPHNTRERGTLRVLIQVANAALKQRMARPKAAQRLLQEAAQETQSLRNSGAAVCMGIDLDALCDLIKTGQGAAPKWWTHLPCDAGFMQENA